MVNHKELLMTMLVKISAQLEHILNKWKAETIDY